MNGAELFVKCLEAEGVKYIFGVPGEENAHFLRALRHSTIKFMLTRHEQAAAFMAEAYGKLTGTVGVCMSTLGPGATNTITGVASAHSDRAPLILITGQSGMQFQHKESHQHIDVVSMMRPVTKSAMPVLHPDNIPETVRQAFKLATREKPGACHIELSNDIACMTASTTQLSVSYIRRSVPDAKIIDMAMDELRAATNPIILAGNGVIRTHGTNQLRAFAEQTGIGVISTFMGKGCVSRHSPNCIFTIGLQTQSLANNAIWNADLVIAVGYDLVEFPPRLWNKFDMKRIVNIDFLPAVVDRDFQLSVEVIGDINHSMWMMNERLKTHPIHFDLPEQRQTRERLLDLFAEHRHDKTEGLIRPQKVLWDVREAMGPSDILLSDVGTHKMWIAQYYHCDEPNTCLIPNGLCSMGSSLPGAIAAKLIHPDRRVMAICGDGGFLMNVQELETAVRFGTNIVVMVWVDNAYNLIEWKQQQDYGSHTDCSFGNPDFVRLAESFGCVGIHVENAVDLAPALERAFKAEKPVVLSLPIDYRENELLTERLHIVT
jgi:acetolactate synthase-1/2/3 large subunit